MRDACRHRTSPLCRFRRSVSHSVRFLSCSVLVYGRLQREKRRRAFRRLKLLRASAKVLGQKLLSAAVEVDAVGWPLEAVALVGVENVLDRDLRVGFG